MSAYVYKNYKSVAGTPKMKELINYLDDAAYSSLLLLILKFFLFFGVWG